jgi:hypothetical protein
LLDRGRRDAVGVSSAGDTALTIGEAQCRLAGEAPGLRARDANEIVEALAEVLESWRDPSSPWRAQLEAELPESTGFSPQVVRRGLARALEPWSADALRRLVQRELGGFAPYSGAGHSDPIACGFDTTAVLLAGSIPMPTILALLLPLLLRSPVLAKTPAADPLSARLFAKSVASIDAQLGRCVEVASFAGEDVAARRAFLRSPCVVAYGSDETMTSVALETTASQRVVFYGHRISVVVLGEACTRGEALASVAGDLALDIALWDQLGCLSPAALYVVAPESGASARVAAALAEALKTLELQLPRGQLSAGVRARVAHERSEAELRAANDQATLHAGADLAHTVVLERDAQWRPTPLHRFIRVHPVESREAAIAALRPVAAQLAAVAIAGFGAERAELAHRLVELGASRICAPGQMQSPPLGWCHDGQSPVLPMLRLGDREV